MWDVKRMSEKSRITVRMSNRRCAHTVSLVADIMESCQRSLELIERSMILEAQRSADRATADRLQSVIRPSPLAMSSRPDLSPPDELTRVPRQPTGRGVEGDNFQPGAM
jgi:hypothetical protein